MLVVQAMHADPAGRRVLQAANAEDRQTVLQPFRTVEAAVRQQSVVAKIDAQRAEDISAGERQTQAGPTEKPRPKRKQCDSVIQRKANGVWPVDPTACERRRSASRLGSGAADGVETSMAWLMPGSFCRPAHATEGARESRP